MKHLYTIEKMEKTCAAFGSFDGLHRGHLSLVQTLVKEACERGLTSVLVDFINVGETAVYTTEEEKECILKENNLDVLISHPAVGVSEIDMRFFIHRLDTSFIAEGTGSCSVPYNVHKNKRTVPIMTCQPIFDGDTIISSIALDDAFSRRDFPAVSRLCGRAYSMTGTVIHGKGRGKKVGMPTINLSIPACKRRPPEGVYATLMHIGGKVHRGVTNIGRRPSVDNENTVTIETFLFDFSEQIYGQKIKLEICSFIRDVLKLDGLEAVKQQVKKDIVIARDFFTASGL
ncbi:riboflavin biosynthesis protein RibF [Treponema sp. OMZ 840]|uniref:riboflavin kinase n=1 Tax=Treponema sp. OMZ 840 TaxID=244313 RepID=UPI003D94635D